MTRALEVTVSMIFWWPRCTPSIADRDHRVGDGTQAVEIAENLHLHSSSPRWMMALAMRPHTTSSAMIPQPPGSFSARLAGQGFSTSSALNSRKPAEQVHTVSGRKTIVTRNPATSSMTTGGSADSRGAVP